MGISVDLCFEVLRFLIGVTKRYGNSKEDSHLFWGKIFFPKGAENNIAGGFRSGKYDFDITIVISCHLT